MDKERDSLSEYLSNPLEYRPNFETEEKERTAWNLRANEQEKIIPQRRDPVSVGGGQVSEVIREFQETKEKLQERVEAIRRKIAYEELPAGETYAPYIEESKKELNLKEGPLGVDDYIAALKSDTPAGAFLVDYVEKWSEGMDGDLNWELLPELVELEQESMLIDKYIQQIIYTILGFEAEGEDWVIDLEENEKQWGRALNEVSKTYLEKKEDYKKAILYSPHLILSARGKVHTSERAYDEKKFEFNQMHNALIVVQGKSKELNFMMDHIDYLLENESKADETEKDFTKLVESLPEELENYQHMQILLHLTVDKENEEKGKLKNTLRTVYSIKTQDKLLDELSNHQEVYRKDTLPLLHYLRGYQSEVGEASSKLFTKLTEGMVENSKHQEDKMHQFFLTSDTTSQLRKQKISNVSEKEFSRQAYRFAKQKEEEQ